MNTLQLEFLMLIFAGSVNRSQQDVIEYLQEENRVLREQLGGKLAATRSSEFSLIMGWIPLRFEEERCPGRPS